MRAFSAFGKVGAILSLVASLVACVENSAPADVTSETLKLPADTPTFEQSCTAHEKKGRFIQEVRGYNFYEIGQIGVDRFGFVLTKYAIRGGDLECPIYIIDARTQEDAAIGKTTFEIYDFEQYMEAGPSKEMLIESDKVRMRCIRQAGGDSSACPAYNGAWVIYGEVEQLSDSPEDVALLPAGFLIINGVIFDGITGKVLN